MLKSNYEGQSVEQALQKGLKDLNVREDQVRINVINEGKKGIFGFMKKDALIELVIIDPELKRFETIESLKKRIYEKKPLAEVNNTVETDKDNLSKDFEIDNTSTKNSSLNEVADQTLNYLLNIIRKMNVDVEGKAYVKSNTVYIELESKKASYIIGKRGKILNSLQVIGQHYMHQHVNYYNKLILDIESYREKRKKTLERLAINSSKKAVKIDKPVKLEPMPNFERKIIHNALSNIKNIETYSEGNEPNRYIVIKKK